VDVALAVAVDEGLGDVVSVEAGLRVGEDVAVDHVADEVAALDALGEEVDAVPVLVRAHERDDEGASPDGRERVPARQKGE
jgi:hypothetical protein